MMGNVFLGSDHAGFKLKEAVRKFLIKGGHPVVDLGPEKYDPDDDYPDYAEKVCKRVLTTNNRGILICGSGLGMSIAANKFWGIYAAVCWNEDSVKQAREHLNTSILCLGANFLDEEFAKKIAIIWLETPFSEEERHIRRTRKVSGIENSFKLG